MNNGIKGREEEDNDIGNTTEIIKGNTLTKGKRNQEQEIN